MSATVRMAWVEMKLFLREPLAVVFAFAFPLFVLFVLGGVFGTELETGDPEEVRIWRGVAPTDYYQPAYVGLVIAAVGVITLPLRLAGYREQGILRRFRAAGVPLRVVLGSQVAVSAAMAIAGGLVIVAASRLAYGTMLPDLALETVAALALSLMTFMAVGMLLGAVLPSSRSAQGAGLILFFVMMMVCGAGPPREVLGTAMHRAGTVLPLTHVILLLQDAWLGVGWNTEASLVLAGFLVATSAAAYRLFRWE